MYIAVCLLAGLAAVSGIVNIDNGIAAPEVIYKIPPNKFKPKCTLTGKPVDILFVLDSSGSLKSKFQDEIDVIKRIVRHVAIGESAARVALVQYSGIQRTEFDFNEITYSKTVLEALSHLRHVSGITKTGAALEYAKSVMNAESGMRGPNVPKIVFLLSDGRTHDYPLDKVKADEIRRFPNTQIWAYGTGDYVAIEELINITGSRDKVVTNQDLNRLEDELFAEFEGEEVCDEVPVCIPGSNKPLDLLIVLDSSESVRYTFEEQKKFVMERILRNIYILIHPKAVRVALINFASTTKIEFKFDDIVRFEPMMREVEGIIQLNGTTRTAEALKQALRLITDSDSGVRDSSVPKLAIVLTDGHSRLNPEGPARRLRNRGVTVYAVGVGEPENVDSSELLRIAGEENQVFTRTKGNLDEDFEQALLKHVGFGCPGPDGDEIFLDESSQPIVRGPVEQSCTSNSVKVTVRTRKPFTGTLFANGHHEDPACVVRGDGSSQVTMTLYDGQCGIKKSKSIESQEPGFNLTGVVTIQFHSDVLTRVDQALELDCFYPDPRANRVDAITTLEPEDATCTYTLHGYEPNGCVVLDATVGETLYHKWACQPLHKNSAYLVHDCFAETDEKTLPYVDSNGCQIDPVIMETPKYDRTPNYVYRQTSVFKFRDASAVKFKCLVSICDTELGGDCNQMIPPNCGEQVGPMSWSSKRPVKTKKGFTVTRQAETRQINIVLNESLKPVEKLQYCAARVRR